MLIIALILNMLLVVCQCYALGHIRGKRNILKYYTYLQNLLSLIVSVLFFLCVSFCLISCSSIPEFIKGLRYVTACGLLAAMFIFLVFLGAGKKAPMTEADFLPGISPQRANFLLHYLCPAVSFVSFVIFEREITVSQGIWTGLAAIPSCGYWVVYLILSAAKLWKEPYDFSAPEEKSGFLQVLQFLLIPLSFMGISFLLWNMQ